MRGSDEDTPKAGFDRSKQGVSNRSAASVAVPCDGYVRVVMPISPGSDPVDACHVDFYIPYSTY
ncbi:hypothetical protein GCM10010981_24260 [Dyella nitratireducens]|uniref:Uncharacterized protein n=1 Tax=Dyella nitratireducens TaxID=1849580 RepID=A0ABQ1G2S1_9GAMM|nr:hypothetical protein GCM10010981_24260 [Dyella nitratireducens]GLQ40860.1 hypothetical protein GCM10007902_07100 [Dyella nitratireducens]